MRFAAVSLSSIVRSEKRLGIFFKCVVLIRVHGSFLQEAHLVRVLLEGNQHHWGTAEGDNENTQNGSE